MTTTLFYLFLQLGIFMGGTTASIEENTSTQITTNPVEQTNSKPGGGDWDDGN